MKKSILFICLCATLSFGASQQNGCIETRLNEVKSIYACPQATFEVIFEIDVHTKKRSEKKEPVLKKIAEAKAPIKQYITKN